MKQLNLNELKKVNGSFVFESPVCDQGTLSRCRVWYEHNYVAPDQYFAYNQETGKIEEINKEIARDVVLRKAATLSAESAVY